jgi:hypothetical protein
LLAFAAAAAAGVGAAALGFCGGMILSLQKKKKLEVLFH